MEQQSTNFLRAGYEALARGAWEEARTAFEQAIEQDETPGALEGLSWAANWLDDAVATIEARERAYRLYRERGDRQSAARMAIWLAGDYSDFRCEPAIADGWFQRARRLLEGLEPTPEHAWLTFMDGYMALNFEHDTATARRLTEEVLAISRALGQIDIEMAGLAQKGLAMVREGEVAEGMRLLDEAATAAVAGELRDLIAIWVSCCYLVNACEQVRDYDRAAQWCAKVEEFCKRYRIRPLFALCRTHYASVLMGRGAWTEAESVLEAANRELAATRPGLISDGIVRLAELRRRQGKWEEAAELFGQVEHDPFAQLGLAVLALDQSDPATTVDLAERFLRRMSLENRIERAAGLEVLVRAQAALGNSAQAAKALAELQSLATIIATNPLQASVNFAAGVVAAAAGDGETARRHLEDAVDLFKQSGAPFEAGRARLELAKVLATLGRFDAAEKEARAALSSFQKVGAVRDAERAEVFLRELKAGTREATTEASALTRLTRREREVLRFIAQGLSNPKIAARLHLSEHTVHRHVANILTKLDFPSRAAAAAFAARHGMI
jgi:ATP/maltotriose-dependent transcriptional regulator MalT